MVLVRLFGGITIEGGGVTLSGKAAHRHRLALLALLAVPPHHAWSRDRLIACLWPEKDAARARNLLNQAVHALRGQLGDDAILSSGDELTLNPERIVSDVRRFQDAIAAGDLRQAVTHYAGSFLDGFFLPNAAEFDHWTDSTREHLRRKFHAALEKLAEQSAASNEIEAAAALWQRRAGEEPGNARITTRFMAALEAVGDQAGALRVARAHIDHLRSEFQAEPSPEVVALAERIRTRPTAAVTSRPDSARAAPPDPDDCTPDTSTADSSAPDRQTNEAFAAPSLTSQGRTRRRTFATTVVVLAVAAVLIGSARTRWSIGLPSTGSGSAPPVVEPAADRAYQRGLHDRERAVSGEMVTPAEVIERFRSAAREFESAIAIAPDWAAAHAELGLTYQWLASSVVDSTAPALYRRAKAAAQRAIALDPRQSQAHATLGFVLYRHEWDWEGADRAFRRAMSLDPGSHTWAFAQFLGAAGRHDEAIPMVRRAIERRPASDALQWQAAQAYACAGRYDEARAAAAELERRMGGPETARREGWRVGAGIVPFTALTFSREGRHAEAVHLMEEYVSATDSLRPALFGLALVKALAGRVDEARALVRRIEERSGQPLSDRAVVLHAALGETARSMDVIERNFRERPWTFAFIRCTDRYWLLQKEPRMQAIIREIGFPR